jgi:hypothetical protein
LVSDHDVPFYEIAKILGISQSWIYLHDIGGYVSIYSIMSLFDVISYMAKLLMVIFPFWLLRS